MKTTPDLFELLEEIYVMSPYLGDFPTGLEDWYAVGNTDGILAYFVYEEDAYQYRLSYINDLLNSRKKSM